jgi:multicomponent K+:H+ antiporter subunit D
MPLIAFSVVGSMGTLLVAVAAFSPTATTAALYYMVHSTFAAACLFLIADLVFRDGRPTRCAPNPRRCRTAFSRRSSSPPPSPWQGCRRSAGSWASSSSSMLARAGRDRLGVVRDPDRLAPDHRRLRAGGQHPVLEIHRDPPARTRSGRDVAPPPPATAAQVAPVMLTLAVLALLAVFAGPVSAYLDDTSAQLFDRDGYVSAVLGPGEEAEPC